MPAKYVTYWGGSDIGSMKKIDGKEVEKIKVGTEVNHEKFGKGKVLDLSGESPNIKATVFFPTSGKKQLLLKIIDQEQ